jgi:hypothetical protein
MWRGRSPSALASVPRGSELDAAAGVGERDGAPWREAQPPSRATAATPARPHRANGERETEEGESSMAKNVFTLAFLILTFKNNNETCGPII